MKERIKVENRYSTGALPTRIDLRDHKWHKVGKSSAPFDWIKGFDLNDTSKVKDQGVSDSCGGQAGAYLDYILSKGNEKSAKYIYSQIFHNGGGTTLREILKLLTSKGACDEKLCSSYLSTGLPPNEAFMEDKRGVTPLTDANASLAKEQGYAFVNPDIESYAQAIRDNNGVIMEIEGENNGTWRSNVPVAPKSVAWRHFLYACGASMYKGQKAVKIRNSWGTTAGQNGSQWITEDYFKSGHVLKGGLVYNLATYSAPEQNKLANLLQQLLNVLYDLKDALGGYFSP